MIPTTPSGRILRVQMGQTVIPFHNEELAGQLLASESRVNLAPVTLDIEAFHQGWNRARLVIDDDAVHSLYESGKAGEWPCYYAHDLGNAEAEEGVGLGVWMTGEPGTYTLNARARLDAPAALRSIHRGVRQRWSLGWDITEGSKVECLECGADLVNDVCACWMAGGRQRLSGQAEWVELSRFPRVAVPGTQSVLVEANRLASPRLLARLKTKLLEARGSKMGQQLAAVLNGQIEASGADRTEVVASLAAAMEMGTEEVESILSAELACPTLPVLQGLAANLGLDAGEVQAAAEADGCEYPATEEAPAEAAPAAAAPVAMSSPTIQLTGGELNAILNRVGSLETQLGKVTNELNATRANQRRQESESVVSHLAGIKIRPDKRAEATQLRAEDPAKFDAIMACVMDEVGAASGLELTRRAPALPKSSGELSVLDEVKRLASENPDVNRAVLWQQVQARRRAAARRQNTAK